MPQGIGGYLKLGGGGFKDIVGRVGVAMYDDHVRQVVSAPPMS